MKNSRIFIAMVILFLGLSTISSAQELSKKTQNRIMDFSKNNTVLSETKKQHLQQIAWTISRKLKNGENVNILLVDDDDQIVAPLAQIWLSSSLTNYGIKDIEVSSAGVEATSFSNELNGLKGMGFKVKNTNGKYRILSGSFVSDIEVHCYDELSDVEKAYSTIVLTPKAITKLEGIPGIMISEAVVFDKGDERLDRREFKALNKQIATVMVFISKKVNEFMNLNNN